MFIYEKANTVILSEIEREKILTSIARALEKVQNLFKKFNDLYPEKQRKTVAAIADAYSLMLKHSGLTDDEIEIFLGIRHKVGFLEEGRLEQDPTKKQLDTLNILLRKIGVPRVKLEMEGYAEANDVHERLKALTRRVQAVEARKQEERQEKARQLAEYEKTVLLLRETGLFDV